MNSLFTISFIILILTAILSKANTLTNIDQELCGSNEIKLKEILGREWSSFKANFNRNYKSSDEEAKRHEIFEKNFAKIKNHNCDMNKSFTKGINEFSDWTEDELKNLLGFGRIQKN